MFVKNCKCGDSVENVDEEPFQSVLCAVCGEQVGVRDTDEVYHFYNVIPSFY